MIQHRSAQAMAWPVGLVVVLAFVVALLVLPLRQWMHQRSDMAKAKRALLAYGDANAELAKEIEKLKTPEGIEMAIRAELGFAYTGEQPLDVLETPNAPTSLPAVWPYTVVSNILSVRAGVAKEKSNDDNNNNALNPLTP